MRAVVTYGMRACPAGVIAPVLPRREMAKWCGLLLWLLFLAHGMGY